MSTASPPRPAHLVTALGKGPYADVSYQLGEHAVHQTPFACVALARSLRPRTLGRASLLLTAEAGKSASAVALEAELKALGIPVERVDIPDGRDEMEILQIFDCVARQIAGGESLVLDVTFGLRHLPFILLASLAYAGALDDTKLKGIYYGAFDLRKDGVAPIFDVTPLLQLGRWSYAIEAARRWGDFRPLAEEARATVDPLRRSATGKSSLGVVRDQARSLAAAFAGGLALEIGQHGRHLIDALERLPEDVDPLAKPLVTALQRLALDIVPVALPQRPPRTKALIALTLDELERELRVARRLLGTGDEPGTMLLLGEWCRSVCLWKRDGSTAQWLGHPARKFALDWAGTRKQDPALQRVIALEGRVGCARNRFAHVGFCTDRVGVSQAEAKACIGEAEAILSLCRSGPPSTPDAEPGSDPPRAPGRLLVTPLGLSPGVLFSGVLQVKPDALVVVTSERARPLVREALEAAESLHLPVRYLVTDDPFFGFDQVRRLAQSDAFRDALSGHAEVVVNLTGGTTALQYGAERLASEAERLGCRVRRVALIDRRSPEEQRANPYVLGEIVDVGGEMDSEHASQHGVPRRR